MSLIAPWLRFSILSAVVTLAACSSNGILPSQSPTTSSLPTNVAVVQGSTDVCRTLASMPAISNACHADHAVRPMADYTYEFKNDTNVNISWHRTDENCMSNNVPNVTDVKPGEKVSYPVVTNGGCCRCSHESSWFVLKYTMPNGDYRDVGFDKSVGQAWSTSNRGFKGDFYYCQQYGGASIKGVMIRGNHCP